MGWGVAASEGAVTSGARVHPESLETARSRRAEATELGVAAPTRELELVHLLEE